MQWLRRRYILKTWIVKLPRLFYLLYFLRCKLQFNNIEKTKKWIASGERLIFKFINSDKIADIKGFQIFSRIKYQNMHRQDQDKIERESIGQELTPHHQANQAVNSTKAESISAEDYKRLMQKVPCETIDELENKLRQNGVIIHKLYNGYIQKLITRKCGNITLLKLIVGYFETEILLFKINMNSSEIDRNLLAYGGFASIFVQHFENKTYAIKSQKISQESFANFGVQLDQILKQFFAYKIAAILQFGPKLTKVFGFDIVFFNDSAEFSMEFCSSPPTEKTEVWKQFAPNLFHGLKTMHSLKIVHMDIKNPNVCWSKSFQKWVFIDFGFVSFIQQKPGEKTYTA